MRITKIFAQGWWPIKGAILALRRLKGLSVTPGNYPYTGMYFGSVSSSVTQMQTAGVRFYNNTSYSNLSNSETLVGMQRVDEVDTAIDSAVEDGEIQQEPVVPPPPGEFESE